MRNDLRTLCALSLAVALGAAGLPRLARAGDRVGNTEIWSIEQLEEFAKTVKFVDGDLVIAPSFDGTSKIVSLPKLESVKGSLSIGGGGLQEIRLPALLSVGGEIHFSSASYPQPELRLVDIGELTQLGGQQISVAWAPLLKPRLVILRDPDLRLKLKFK